ncbi:hypothetical protein DLAC_03362 [Tieghemostelium lacteum]|uniref:EF-hand domain-containing protein n=1 Tax=Tieghemostelium lacteum TaxID=361077 RepID=A0A152A1X0_TIELA|nr:hypothetical protein DLAC_03362 [Tieghemostelium lacteum]|eukprot:KYR00204.1 hypothetical protein DLAC_03362 [Tieghemostelium lacteum]
MDQSGIEKLFSEYDPEGNGYINTEQLKNLVFRVTGKEVTQDENDILISQLDKDRDGKISLQEFIIGCDNKVIGLDDFLNQSGYRIPESPEDYEKHLKFIFSLFDKDEDGLVDIDELREMLADIKTQSGFEEDKDDDDIEYIIKILCSNGQKQISFQQFMKALEQINSPSINSPHMSQNNIDTDQLDQIEDDETGDHSGFHSGSSRPSSPLVNQDGDDSDQEGASVRQSQETFDQKQKRRNRGRASSWVAPGSIVNMIKKRTDLFTKEEMEVFDSTADPEVEQYRKRADILKSQNEHFVSKLNMFEGQLKQARESHDKLSEDNVKLKESIVIGKRTLIENQKLSGHNKRLEDDVETLKHHLSQVEDQRTEIIRTHNKLKTDREQLLAELQLKEQAYNELEKRYRKLEEQTQNVVPVLANTYLEQIPSFDELEKLKVENGDLKKQLRQEMEKSENHIGLLNEEYQLLKKQSKEDKALLESSNQIIHKLRVTLDDLQSNGHESDPNYKLSLLSELEQQVVTRLGTPGTFDGSDSPPHLTSNPISIKSNSHHTGERIRNQSDSDDLDIISEQLEKQMDISKNQEKQIQELQEENQKLKFKYESLTKSVDSNTNIDPINIKAGQTQDEISLLMQRINSVNTQHQQQQQQAQLQVPVQNHSELQSNGTPISSPTSSIQDLDLVGVGQLSSSLSNPSQGVIEGLQHEIKTLNTVKQQLERDLRRYEIMSSTNSTSVKSSNDSLIDELKRDNEKLNERFRAIEYENLLVKEENKDVKEQSVRLQERIEIMKSEFETKYNQIQVSESKSQLVKENEELKTRLKRYERDDNNHHIDIIEMEDETKNLKARIEDLSIRLQNEKNHTKFLQERLDQDKLRINDSEPLIPKQPKHDKKSCCIIC